MRWLPTSANVDPLAVESSAIGIINNALASDFSECGSVGRVELSDQDYQQPAGFRLQRMWIRWPRTAQLTGLSRTRWLPTSANVDPLAA